MNLPPAPESMSPRVSMFFTSEPLIQIGIDSLFEFMIAVVTEQISIEGDTGIDPDLLIKNPLWQRQQKIHLCLLLPSGVLSTQRAVQEKGNIGYIGIVQSCHG